MGMSQMSISPAEGRTGSYEGTYDGLYRRPRDATRLAEADPAARSAGPARHPLTGGRGAQRAARLLVDRLDEPGAARHGLLALFDGPPEVAIDVPLGHQGGDRPAEGFEPRLALRLRKVLSRLGPVAVVAHGGDAMKYAVPAVVGTRCPLVYCVIGTYAGPSAPLHVRGVAAHHGPRRPRGRRR